MALSFSYFFQWFHRLTHNFEAKFDTEKIEGHTMTYGSWVGLKINCIEVALHFQPSRWAAPPSSCQSVVIFEKISIHFGFNMFLPQIVICLTSTQSRVLVL